MRSDPLRHLVSWLSAPTGIVGGNTVDVALNLFTALLFFRGFDTLHPRVKASYATPLFAKMYRGIFNIVRHYSKYPCLPCHLTKWPATSTF
jgi:hypothetical protein